MPAPKLLQSLQPDCVAVFRYGFAGPDDAGQPTNPKLVRSQLERFGFLPVITSQQIGALYRTEAPKVLRRQLARMRARGLEVPSEPRVTIVNIDSVSNALADVREPEPGELLVINVDKAWRSDAVFWHPVDVGASRDLVRQGTVEFMAQALEVAQEMAWLNVAPYSLDIQAPRIRTIARGLRRANVVERDGLANFVEGGSVRLLMDPQSSEFWTRTRLTAAPYEVVSNALTRAAFLWNRLPALWPGERRATSFATLGIKHIGARPPARFEIGDNRYVARRLASADQPLMEEASNLSRRAAHELTNNTWWSDDERYTWGLLDHAHNRMAGVIYIEPNSDDRYTVGFIDLGVPGGQEAISLGAKALAQLAVERMGVTDIRVAADITQPFDRQLALEIALRPTHSIEAATFSAQL